MDFFDLQQEVPASTTKSEDIDNESVTQDEREAISSQFAEESVAEPAVVESEAEVEAEPEKSAADIALDAMRDLTKVIRSKAKVVEQIAEKKIELTKLTDELRGMLNGEIDQTEERDDYTVAVERKKAETDLERLQKRADPNELRSQINATIEALENYQP